MREVHGEGGGGEGGGEGGGRWEREVMFEEQMFDEIQPPSTYPRSQALIQLLSLAVWKSERYCWCQKAEWRPGNETKPSRTQKVDSSNELRTNHLQYLPSSVGLYVWGQPSNVDLVGEGEVYN